MYRNVMFVLVLLRVLHGAPRDVSFSQPAGSVEGYDFLEVTATVTAPDARNPFTDATLSGSFAKALTGRDA